MAVSEDHVSCCFTNILLSRQKKIRRCCQQRGRRAERTNVKYDWLMIAFITWNSSLVPLLEGLCSSNPCRFEFSVFWVFARIKQTTQGLTVPRSDQLSYFLIVSDRNWQVSSGNTGWAQRSEVTASEAQSQRVMDLTKKERKWEQIMWICGIKGKGSKRRWDAKKKDPARTVWN